MEWETKTLARFEQMVAKIPVFHRGIAQEAVTKKAEEIAKARNALSVEEQDVIAAFFLDVPSPFFSMMVRLLEQSGFDYKKYGYPRNSNHKK